jgi:mono/diheme cytochrome c family protein
MKCAGLVMTRVATAALFAASLAVSASAAEPAAADDARAGRALSLKLCTPCHVVSPDQELPPILRPRAPSFRTIANRPGTTDESLRRFLTETHASLRDVSGMPNPQLTEDQVREAAAFIMSLRKPR